VACDIDIFIWKQAADTTREGIKNDTNSTVLSRRYRHTGSALHRFSGATQYRMAGAGAGYLCFPRSNLSLVFIGYPDRIPDADVDKKTACQGKLLRKGVEDLVVIGKQS
jgi:hypothetical protein